MRRRLRINPNPPALAGNVITNPYALDNASFNIKTAMNAVTADATLAPDGSMNADLCVPSTSSSAAHNIRQSVLTTTAAAWICRCRLKAAGYRHVEIIVGSTIGYASFLGFTFDVKSGTVGVKRASAYDGYARCLPLSYGWFLCDMVILAATANSTHTAELHFSNTPDPLNTYSGDGVAGVYAWGFEFAPVPN